MASKMFTHLPSRSIFIDDDLYLGLEWLGHWMAHELGHLATNSAKEEDAERAAREYRMRLQAAAKESRLSHQRTNRPQGKQRRVFVELDEEPSGSALAESGLAH
jgi:hypothetical protein